MPAPRRQPFPGRPQGSPLSAEHVILSAAKDLCPRRVRPFPFAALRAAAHALRVTVDGRPPESVALENLFQLTLMGLAPALPPGDRVECRFIEHVVALLAYDVTIMVATIYV